MPKLPAGITGAAPESRLAPEIVLTSATALGAAGLGSGAMAPALAVLIGVSAEAAAGCGFGRLAVATAGAVLAGGVERAAAVVAVSDPRKPIARAARSKMLEDEEFVSELDDVKRLLRTPRDAGGSDFAEAVRDPDAAGCAEAVRVMMLLD